MSTPKGFDGQTLPLPDGTSRVVGPNDVVSNGQIIGTDPDENVRAEILRQGGSTPAADGGGSE